MWTSDKMESTENYHRLNRRCMASMYTGYAVLLALVGIFVAAIYVSVGETDFSREVRITLIVLFAILLIYCLVAPPVFYRHYRYLLDGEKIDVVCGVIFIRHTFVPIERVMQVEVTHGPINRMWGLADVVVTTAGGVAQIQYMEPDEAERVANDLGQIVNKVLRARGRA